MDCIPYDILENIIIYLDLDLSSIINLLLSSQKISTLYIKNDETYGCNRITNRIIRECALFFKINDKINYNLEDKRLLATTLIKIYNVYKNNKLYNNSDILVYIMENNIMENNIQSNELFRCLCLKSKFCEKMERISKNKNIISNTDMKYMIINVDKCKLEIILNSFHIKSDMIAYCINELLKYKKEDYDIKIKICINYIFYKYCFKTISQYDKNYFIHIFTYFILHDNKNLLKYFMDKLEKYLKIGILNVDYITQIIYSELGCYNYDYLKTFIKNYLMLK